MTQRSSHLSHIKNAAWDVAHAKYRGDPDATIKVLRDISVHNGTLYAAAVEERRGKAAVVNAQIAKVVKAAIGGVNAGRAEAAPGDACRTYQRFIPAGT